jgi:hypothetical protein
VNWIAAHQVLFAAIVIGAYLVLAAVILRLATSSRKPRRPAAHTPRHGGYRPRHEIGAHA